MLMHAERYYNIYNYDIWSLPWYSIYPSIAYSTYVQNKDCLEDKKRYHLDSIENELDLKKS